MALDSKALLQYVSNELKSMNREQATIATAIPSIKVDLFHGVIPVDRTATAYNLQNNYAGDAIYSIVNDELNIDNVAFSIDMDDFFFGVSDNKIKALSDLTRDDKALGRQIVNSITDSFSKRNKLYKENKLATILAKDETYASTNIVDLTTNKISDWTIDDAQKFIGAITQLKNNFNLAIGGGLFDERGNMVESGVRAMMIIPSSVWASITTNIKAFDNYLSKAGIAGDYRMITTEMFKAVVGVDVLVGSSVKITDQGERLNKFDSSLAKEVWSDSNIYFITCSDILTDLAGLKYLVRVDYELFTDNRLGDAMFRSKTAQLPVITNNYALGKIKVKLN